MTRLNWDLTWHEAKWFRKTKILKFGWLLKLPKNLEIAQKVNECLLEPVTEPNGFKLDMHGPEGSIYPLLRVRSCFDGLEVQKWLRVKKKWLWSQRKFAKYWSISKGNLPLKQIWIKSNELNPMDYIESNRMGLNQIESNRIESDRIEILNMKMIGLKSEIANAWRLTLRKAWWNCPKNHAWKLTGNLTWNWPESQRYWPNSQRLLSGLKLTWKLT